jgi:antitoxin FitA
MTITIDLANDKFDQLVELAKQSGLSVEEFAQREINLIIERQAAFDLAANYVLKKNAELYRRLAK